MTRRGRSPKSLPAGRAIGWWIAGFEERIYPERETVRERIRWGAETRIASGPGSEVVVRFPDAAGPRGAEGDAAPTAAPVDDPGAEVEPRDSRDAGAEHPQGR